MKPFILAMVWGLIIGLVLADPLSIISEKVEKLSQKYIFLKSVSQRQAKNLVAAGLITFFSLLAFLFFIVFFKESYSDIASHIQGSFEVEKIQGLLASATDFVIGVIQRVPDILLNSSKKQELINKINSDQILQKMFNHGMNYFFSLKKNDLSSGGGSIAAIGTVVINVYIFILFVFGLVLSNPDQYVEKKLNKKLINQILGFDLIKIYYHFKKIVELQINVVLENSMLQGIVLFIALIISGEVDMIYALFLSMLGIFFTLLPAVGISLIIVPGIILSLMYGKTFLFVLLVMAQIICFIDEWYLRQIYYRPFSGPLMKLIGQTSHRNEQQSNANHEMYELPAVFYLISQIGGASIFGLSGFILGPIIFSLIKIIAREWFTQSIQSETL
jgi:predicted PurR-regulated permease PerM